MSSPVSFLSLATFLYLTGDSCKVDVSEPAKCVQTSVQHIRPAETWVVDTPPRACSTRLLPEGPPTDTIPAPPTHLILNVCMSFFCCMPFSIVGIYNSIMCYNATLQGNTVKAERYSRAARFWGMLALGTGYVIESGILIYFMWSSLSESSY